MTCCLRTSPAGAALASSRNAPASSSIRSRGRRWRPSNPLVKQAALPPLTARFTSVMSGSFRAQPRIPRADSPSCSAAGSTYGCGVDSPSGSTSGGCGSSAASTPSTRSRQPRERATDSDCPRPPPDAIRAHRRRGLALRIGSSAVTVQHDQHPTRRGAGSAIRATPRSLSSHSGVSGTSRCSLPEELAVSSVRGVRWIAVLAHLLLSRVLPGAMRLGPGVFGTRRSQRRSLVRTAARACLVAPAGLAPARSESGSYRDALGGAVQSLEPKLLDGAPGRRLGALGCEAPRSPPAGLVRRARAARRCASSNVGRSLGDSVSSARSARRVPRPPAGSFPRLLLRAAASEGCAAAAAGRMRANPRGLCGGRYSPKASLPRCQNGSATRNRTAGRKCWQRE